MDPAQENRSMNMIAHLSGVHTVLPGDGYHFIGDAQENFGCKQVRLNPSNRRIKSALESIGGTAMSQHGTAFTLGQYNQILAAIQSALPKALDEIDSKQLIAGLSGRGEVLERNLHDLFAKMIATQGHDCPRDGEIFHLTADGDESRFNPLEMVSNSGYMDSKQWYFNGEPLDGITIRGFELAPLQGVDVLGDAISLLSLEKRSVPGQFISAFRSQFPEPGKKGPIGIADASWIDAKGNARFPYIDTDGKIGFAHVENLEQYGNYWRWIVPILA